MFKKILVITVLAFMLACVGCTNTSTNTSDSTCIYVYIELPNGECIEGRPDSVFRFSESTVDISMNGVVYRTHSDNVVFVYGDPTENYI